MVSQASHMSLSPWEVQFQPSQLPNTTELQAENMHEGSEDGSGPTADSDTQGMTVGALL